MAYYIQKQGKWRGQFGSSANRKTKSFATQVKAEAWEQEQLLALGDTDPTTWNDLASRYFLSVAFAEKSAKTQSGERAKAVPVLAYFGRMLVVKTDDITVDDYREARQRTISPRTGRALAGNTVRLELAFLSILVNLAIKRRILRSNFMVLVSRPKCAGKYLRISEQDLVRLFQNAMPPDPCYCFFWLLFATGCRSGELAELKIADVNLSLHQIYFARTKNTRSRTVILPPYEFDVLVAWLKRPERDKQCPYVFPSRNRRSGDWVPFNVGGYWSHLKKRLEQGIDPRITPHSLRHERISRWFLDPRLNEGMIMELSGHLTASALNSYRHLSVEKLRHVVSDIMSTDHQTLVDTFESMQLSPPPVFGTTPAPDFERVLASL